MIEDKELDKIINQKELNQAWIKQFHSYSL